MFNALRNPTARDNRALAVFFGIALLCAIYFASGILVSYVSSPSEYVEMARDGKGVLIEVSGLESYETALQVRRTLEPRQLQSTIDFSPTSNGYVLRIGPVATRSMAEQLAGELKENGYEQIGLRESCPGGGDCAEEKDTGGTIQSGPRGSGITIEPGGPTGPTGRTTQTGRPGRPDTN
ncbi:MAG: hypothetical protein RIR52_1034 [Acidobacteriota bacterium]|jgi:hypothetical protein